MNENIPDKLFNNWNIFWLAITSLSILVLFFQLQFNHSNFKAQYLFILTVGIPAILIMFQYRQLRKKHIFISWTIIALILLISSFWTKDDPQLLLKSKKSVALGLKTPIAFLISYYIFNKISTKYFSTELIIPPRYSRYDKEEGRNVNLLDRISLFFYFIIIILTGLY